MKYIYTLLVMAIVSFVIITINPSTVHSNSTGAPVGSTGSPSDGKTCSQTDCHNSTPAARAGLITSDIPSTGYVGGTQYKITAKISEPQIVKFGFQVSPELGNGGQAGTLATIDANTMVPSNRYITHSFNGTTGSGGSKTWSFSWTAPATGSGPVTFYGAFLAGNNDGLASDLDKVFTSTMVVGEDGHLSAKTIAQAGMDVYPVPFNNTLTIDRGVQQFETATVKLYTLEGKLAAQGVMNGERMDMNTDGLAKGFYILNIEAANLHVVQKVVK